MRNTVGLGVVSFFVSLVATVAYGQARTPYTRPSSITTTGPVSAANYNATTASGNQAYTCSNVGCRLSLGSTARYLVDDGTNLEFIAPVQATTFEATTASGSSLTGGGASGALEITSNTTDAATSGTVPAIRLKASQNITDTDLLMSVEDSAGNRRLAVTEVGSLDVGTDINDVRDVYVTRYFFSNGEMIVNGALRRTSSSVTIADNGGGTPATHTQAYLSTVASFVRYTCNDADGCAVTMSETAVEHGHVLMFANTSANNVTFADIAGVQEMAGGVTATLGQYDTLQLVYTGDRWAELHRSDN